MKRPSPMIRRGTEVDMDSAMTPMIDVVFLLLVFFVWTASFQIVEHILPPTELSKSVGSDPIDQADPPPPKDFDDVVVKIGWDGQNPSWNINGQQYPSLVEVRKQLTAISGIGAEAPVILAPERIVPLGFVIETFDVAMLSGFEKVSFAVKAKGR